MRILQVINSISSLGGLERFAQRFSLDVLAAGHETAVVELQAIAEPPKSIPAPGFPVVQPSEPFSWIRRWKPDVVLSHQAGDGPFLRHLCAEHRVVELIQTVLCPGGKLMRRSARICQHKMGLRCLVDWYAGPCGSTMSPVAAIHGLKWSRERAEAVANAHAVFVASDWMKEHAIQEGVDSGRLHVVNIARGIAPPGPLRALPTEDGPVRLLFAGRLSQNKGVQYAIEALTKLPGRFSLRIVGDGWFRPSLERIAQRLGVAKRITFSGAAETTGMHVVYNDADILLVPSIWPEPAGLVIPEARAQGLRVAAFAVGGIPYWLSAHGLDGVFLARPSDVDSLLSAIYRALSGAVGDYLPPSPAPEDFLDALVAIGTELHVGA